MKIIMAFKISEREILFIEDKFYNFHRAHQTSPLECSRLQAVIGELEWLAGSWSDTSSNEENVGIDEAFMWTYDARLSRDEKSTRFFTKQISLTNWAIMTFNRRVGPRLHYHFISIINL